MKDLVGKKFGKLTVIKFSHKKNNTASYQYYWLCKCECGKDKLISGSNLPHTKSCGCIHLGAKIIHGMSKNNSFYFKWVTLKQRHTNKNNEYYRLYGGKGLKLQKRWMDFIEFKEDMYDSYLEYVRKNGKKRILLAMVDFKKGYNKKNCYWINRKDLKMYKKVIYKNKEITLNELSMKLNIKLKLLMRRLRDGYSDADLGIEKDRQRRSLLLKNKKFKVVKKLNLEKLININSRDRRAFKYRFGIGGKQHSLEETGTEFGVTRERIRQICNLVIKKMKLKENKKI